MRYSSVLPIALVVTALAHVSPVRAGGYFIFEAATGLGSPYSPWSSEWQGRVASGGLHYKEYGLKGTYVLGRRLSFSLTAGLLNDRYTGARFFPTYDGFPPPYGHDYPLDLTREVYYLIPSVQVSGDVYRFSLGNIVYAARTRDIPISSYDYPFDGGHRFRPSVGIELGENGFYAFFRVLQSFPLYSGGGRGEIGVGGRVGGIYEHKVFFTSGAFHNAGLGYRGEVELYRDIALSFGFSIGGRDGRNEFMMTVGVKTVRGK